MDQIRIRRKATFELNKAILIESSLLEIPILGAGDMSDNSILIILFLGNTELAKENSAGVT